jgi:predicted metal-binding membrane protein
MTSTITPATRFLWLKQKLLGDLNWIWILVAIAWFALILTGHHFHHQHHMTHTYLPPSLVALGSWETMIVAMMLPGTLPTARAFIHIATKQSDRVSAQFAFLSAYMAVWTGFAGLVFAGDLGVDYGLEKLYQLGFAPVATPFVMGWTLMGMGLFQFTPMKKACLKGCRSGALFIAQRYEKGWQAAWKLGVEHGLYCLGCCWALMIGMMILGMENLWLMLLFSAVMVMERVWKYGERLSIAVGIALVFVGGLSFMPSAAEIWRSFNNF